MIAFDLKCGVGHVFEAWFGSSDRYEEQRVQGLIACPLCGNSQVAKAVMAPNVVAKGNQRAPVPPVSAPPGPSSEAPPEVVKAALAMLARAQAKMLESSRWVGTGFADTALAMHLGEVPEAPIHGQATREQAEQLAEDGVPIAPLPFPVVPPARTN